MTDVCRCMHSVDTLAVEVYLGGLAFTSIRSLKNDKSFLPRWLTHTCAKNPLQGPKTLEIFATPFWNSIPLSYYLKKVEVKAGTGYSWRILFPDD